MTPSNAARLAEASPSSSGDFDDGDFDDDLAAADVSVMCCVGRRGDVYLEGRTVNDTTDVTRKNGCKSR